MASKLGSWLKEARERWGIPRQGLAATLGYRNLNNGARRIRLLEENGEFDPHWKPSKERSARNSALIRQIVAVLYLNPEEAVLLAAVDDAERPRAIARAWIDPADLEPVRLLARPLRAVCIEVALPSGLPSDSSIPELLKHVPTWVADLFEWDSRRVHVIRGPKRLESAPAPEDGHLGVVRAEAGPFMQVRGRGPRFRFKW